MKKLLLVAALTLMALPAFAQGNSPYNATGTSAGGPLAGRERRMGAPGGEPATFSNPRTYRAMRHHRRIARRHRHM